jgi:gamma-glutamyl-gamma-aminobutyrate hydrolase PuuD
VYGSASDAVLLRTAVERAEGQWHAVPAAGASAIAQDLSIFDGLLLSCGHSEAVARLLNDAIAAGMPVLCVGQGMHALNRALGGKGAYSVAGHGSRKKAGAAEDAPAYHRIFIPPGARLASIVGSGGFVRVNSRHATGITEAQKSPSLRASAYGLEDGVIEALESPTHENLLAVQFNPERASELPPHFLRLFQWLVNRSREFAENRAKTEHKNG